jgi:hypothetical protein
MHHVKPRVGKKNAPSDRLTVNWDLAESGNERRPADELMSFRQESQYSCWAGTV